MQALTLPHEKIIANLDEAGATFKIVIIKTDMTLPYTSVFIRLDCGYWNAAGVMELESIVFPHFNSGLPQSIGFRMRFGG